MTNVGQNIHAPNLSGLLRRKGSLQYCYMALAVVFRTLESFGFLLILTLFLLEDLVPCSSAHQVVPCITGGLA